MNAIEAEALAKQQYRINIGIARLSGKRVTKKVKKHAEDMAIVCVIPMMLRDTIEEVLEKDDKDKIKKESKNDRSEQNDSYW
jgi:hypothetical protein